VWAVTVEVVFVGGQDGGRVVLVHDEGSVEEFAADAADESFGDRVRPWGLDRRLDHLDVGGGEDGVERRGELGVPIADQEPDVLAGFIQVHGEVAGQLGQPGAGRVRGDAEDADLASGVFDDEERVEPGQGDGVEVEQVAGEDGWAWARRNSRQEGPDRRDDGSMPAACKIFRTVEAPIW
jgi:hypothetical protein